MTTWTVSWPHLGPMWSSSSTSTTAPGAIVWAEPRRKPDDPDAVLARIRPCPGR